MKIGAVDAVVLEEASDSTVEFIHLLWDTGSWYGAVMVAIFAIVVPSLKMILLILGEIWRCSEDRSKVASARMYIRFVQIISKWACPDIIAYIFLYYLDLGFTCYTLFCWGSTISSLGVHLPVLDEGMTASTDTARPWALRRLGSRGTAAAMLVIQTAFVVCFVLGMTWSCLGLRLESKILEQNGLPQWQIDAMRNLHVAEHAKADVTIFQCVEMLMEAQSESFDTLLKYRDRT
eukprot:g16700.t1